MLTYNDLYGFHFCGFDVLSGQVVLKIAPNHEHSPNRIWQGVQTLRWSQAPFAFQTTFLIVSSQHVSLRFFRTACDSFSKKTPPCETSWCRRCRMSCYAASQGEKKKSAGSMQGCHGSKMLPWEFIHHSNPTKSIWDERTPSEKISTKWLNNWTFGDRC